MTDYSDTPRIHFWVLSDYNSGKLVGDWIELDSSMTHEDVLETLHDKMKEYDEELGTEDGPREKGHIFRNL